MPRLRLLLLASTLVLGVLAPLTPAVADAANTVSITSPTQGTTATGIVTVSVVGDSASPSASDSMLLMVDGVQYGVGHTCAANVAHSCAVSFAWDTTGMNGARTLEAIFVSGSTTQSSPVTVTAVNPAPTVTLSAPTSGRVVKGPLAVTALGSVDLTQNDAPVSLQLLVDGLKYGLPASCAVVVTTAKTCAGTFTVPTAGTSGTHTVQVTMTTTVSSAVSAIVPYQVFTGLKATLHKLAPVRGGRSVGISGQVTAVDGGRGVAHVKVKITLTPKVGKARSLIVRTGGTGHFSVAAKIVVGTTIAASVAKTSSAGTAYAVTKIAAYAPITCKISKTLVHQNEDQGTCVVPSLPDKTKVSLQYLKGKTWKTLGSGLTLGTSIPISFTFPKKGHYQVRVVLGANKAYLATHGNPFTITVT